MRPDEARNLVESSINSPADRPLIGISIDGCGQADGAIERDGVTYNAIREIAQLPSADLVTSAGAGGKFLSPLSESAKEPVKPKRKPVDARKRDAKVREATDRLSDALAREDAAAASKALAKLRRWSASPVAQGDATSPRAAKAAAGFRVLPPGGSEAPRPGVPPRASGRAPLKRARKVKEARKRARKAEKRLREMKRIALVERVVREEDVPPTVARVGYSALHEAAQAGEQAVRKVARGLVQIDSERQRAGADRLRESLGLGVEGCGPRGLGLPWTNGDAGKDLLAAMHIYTGADQ